MDDRIELKHYIGVVVKHWAVIVIATAMMIGGAMLLTWATKPVYESGAKLLVSERASGSNRELADAFQGILISERLAKTYSQLAQRVSFLEEAGEIAGVGGSGAHLKDLVTVTPIKDTQIIEVLARGGDPRTAANFANAIGDLLVAEADGTAADSAIAISIIETARPTDSPLRPKPSVNLFLGLILGLGVGVMLAFLRDHFDTRIKDADDLQMTLGSVPVLAQIPRDDESRVDRLVVRSNSQTPTSEAFRALRTSLGYLNYDGQLKTLIFGSVNPREGKTTIAANFAAVLAHAGKRVLVIGADMRRPRLHEALSVKSDVGLSSVLIAASTLDEAIQATGTEGLFVLPSGPIPPNPAELLGSRRMNDLLMSSRERFDYVLLDTPPILAVTDAMVLGGVVDGFVLVARVGETQREAIERAIEPLKKLKAKFVGAVLNGAKAGARYDYIQDSKPERLDAR